MKWLFNLFRSKTPVLELVQPEPVIKPVTVRDLADQIKAQLDELAETGVVMNNKKEFFTDQVGEFYEKANFALSSLHCQLGLASDRERTKMMEQQLEEYKNDES